MIILSPSSEVKIIQVIPRNLNIEGNYTLTIKRDGDKATEEISNATIQSVSKFVEIAFSSTILTEDSTYSLEITNDGALWYRDKMYVTSRITTEIEVSSHIIGNNTIYKSYNSIDDNTYIINDTSGSTSSDSGDGDTDSGLAPNIALNSTTTYDIQIGVGYYLDVRTFNGVDSWTIDTDITGLQISNTGLLYGVVDGVNRTDTVTVTATNTNGSDSVVLNFNISDTAIVEDPTNADANSNYTGNPSDGNSDSVGTFAEVPDALLNNGTPYPLKEDGKIYYVRIGAPYLFQLSIDNNGGGSDRTTYVSNVFDDIKFYPAINRFYGVPTGLPRTENIVVTAENGTGSNDTSFDFELIENVGADALLAPYNLRNTPPEGIDAGFFLRFNRREYSGVMGGYELYRNDILIRTVATTNNSYSISSTKLQLQSGTNTWKVRMFNDLGDFSEFSNEVTTNI